MLPALLQGWMRMRCTSLPIPARPLVQSTARPYPGASSHAFHSFVRQLYPAVSLQPLTLLYLFPLPARLSTFLPSTAFHLLAP